jgi:hypothetical protein
MKKTDNINTKNTNINNTMMDNAIVWANYYSPRGDLRDSVPYETNEDAVRHITEMLEGIAPYVSERMQYKRVSELEWENEAGCAIEVQTVGNPVLYIKNEWVAISANYAELEQIPTDDWFIQWVYESCGLDTKRIGNFAEWFYGHHLDLLFGKID